MLRIHPFQKNHLEDAAALVVSRYQNLYALEPLLPDRYLHQLNILPHLESLYNAGSPGVVAIQDGKLVGFLMGWTMEEFRGKKSTFSPEWANAAKLDNSKFIYQEMHQALTEKWVAAGYVAHYITIFANDHEAITACQWLGYGMFSVDAIRGLEPVQRKATEVEIRLANPKDLDDIVSLNQGLRAYMMGSPSFFIPDTLDKEVFQAWIDDPQKDIWLAYSGDEPLAFFRVGPANHDVSLIIVDEKTTSIYGAYTKETERGKEIASALLAKMIEAGINQGYQRCAVDFESMNTLGSRFWLRHFNPVCYSLVRYIDERLVGE
jgi:GNAT superfamily N-acetyltransferase